MDDLPRKLISIQEIYCVFFFFSPQLLRPREATMTQAESEGMSDEYNKYE